LPKPNETVEVFAERSKFEYSDSVFNFTIAGWGHAAHDYQKVEDDLRWENFNMFL
jgi:hypothetical protein